LVGCLAKRGQTDPSTRITQNGVFVAFQVAPAATKPGVVREGDRATLTIGRAQVLVQAEPAMRRRILATVEPVEVDAYGCPVQHPISSDPASRPSPAVPLRSLKGVSDISICKYRLDHLKAANHSAGQASLVSSTRLSGRTASSALHAIETAPLVGGPNQPDSCSIGSSYGDDAIVLRIHSRAGVSEVYLRYSGCDHNGLDDGVNTYRLSRRDVSPFVGGPNHVFAASGPTSKGLW
jgi:hypothetical protein